ncbi:MAG: haloacid dehalogenase type II [Candidatus Dormibacteraceae bacterium]
MIGVLMARATIAFDIIGTCFSFVPMRRRLAEIGAGPLVFDLWFAQVLRDAFALSHSGGYTQLRNVFAAELPRTLRSAGIDAAEAEVASVVSLFAKMPAQPGLGEATQLLRDAGCKVIALTQGARDSTAALLAGAGLASAFDLILSADEVAKTKPHPDVYGLALAATEGEAWMVAAHAWDIAGAARAGMRTVFVAVDESEYLPGIYPPPDLIAPDLVTAAHSIRRSLDGLG